MPDPLPLKELKLRMQAYGIRPRKKFGQNLLLDFNMLQAIVADAEVTSDDVVLEIGTGAGSLTGYLCDHAGAVVTVEIDDGMFKLSRDILHACENLVQLKCDALDGRRTLNPEVEAVVHEMLDTGTSQPNLDDDDYVVRVAEPKARKSLKVVANLPYSVAGAVIFGLLESSLNIERFHVMVQFEMAEKFAAKQGHSEWGLPSLLRSRLADARMVRRVPAKVFWPKPRVDSAILELKPFPNPDREAFARLRALAHVLFQNRRKSSANALAIALKTDNWQGAQWIEESGGDPMARAEALTPDMLQTLADRDDVQDAVKRAGDAHEEQLRARAEKLARRNAWKARLESE